MLGAVHVKRRSTRNADGGSTWHCLIDVRDRKERGQDTAPTAEGVCVALSVDGRSLLWCARKDTALQLWDLEQGQHVCTLKSYAGAGATGGAGAFSPDGKLIAVGGTNHSHAASFWDTQTGQRGGVSGRRHQLYTVPFTGQQGSATSTAMRGDPMVRLWEAETGRLLRSFAAHRFGVHDVAYTPDGTRADHVRPVERRGHLCLGCRHADEADHAQGPSLWCRLPCRLTRWEPVRVRRPRHNAQRCRGVGPPYRHASATRTPRSDKPRKGSRSHPRDRCWSATGRS